MRLSANLAVVDYQRNDLAERKVIDRCPTGAIVWYANPDIPAKGAAARKVLRNEPLPVLN